jgi:hypothetical protein
MRVPPQVSERIKEAPAQALRGVFAGIGQLLLITDKLRNKAPAGAQVPQTRAPAPTEKDQAAPQAQAAAAPAGPAAAQAPAGERVPEARDFDKTGNVRLLDSDKAGTDTAAPAAEATAEAPVTTETSAAAETPVTTETSATAESADAGGADAGDAGMPLPNYDALSIASLRARLRNLDVTQVRQLAEYEKAHAARADVIVMFERRIAKLEAEGANERGEAKAEAEVEAQEDVATEVRDDVEAEAEGEA